MSLPPRNTPASITLSSLIERNLRTDLGSYLRKVAGAALLGIALTASACGPAAGEEYLDVCGDSEWDYFDAFAADSPGYLVIISDRTSSSMSPGDSPTTEWRVLAHRGEPCTDATSPDECAAAVNGMIATARSRMLIYTDRDGAHSLTSGPELAALLGGEITTAGAAALAAHLAGYGVDCVGADTAVDGYYEIAAVTSSYSSCNTSRTRHHLQVARDGTVTLVDSSDPVSTTTCAVGRRPAGLAAAEDRETIAPVADLFSEITRLEASAVAAFDVMIEELAELGAPDSLVNAAQAARADEVRHVEMMGRLARAYGSEPGAPRIAPPQKRSAFAIALENAIEGCVRETYGALVAVHQANAAEDPRVAATMETIAADEIRHAELSWALAGWLEPRLTASERRAIRRAKRAAVADLARDAQAPVDESVVRLAGMPSPATHVRMVEALSTQIWV